MQGRAAAAQILSFLRTNVRSRITEPTDWKEDDKANKCGQQGGDLSLFQHRSQSPLRGGQTARLALESNRGHTAPVGNAAGLYGRASGRATRLRIEGEERHPFGRHAI